MFPGDIEFTFAEYSSLPFEYVLLAYENGVKNQNKHYHMAEVPTALLTSVLANCNRDSKKKREAYKMDDFFIYQAKEERNIPSSVFGAAAMELVRLNLFPVWGLFTYKDLKAGAGGPAPEILAYIGEDILVLAPNISNNELTGMLIITESAYGKERTITSPCGKSVKVVVPKYHGKVYAEENISIRVIA